MTSVLGKDPQPGHMSEYVRTWQDNVYINSGIPNKAFYLVATNIGGLAWETAGRIRYEALISPTLSPRATFRQFARETIMAASDLFGPNSAEQQAVSDAWDEVGCDCRPRGVSCGKCRWPHTRHNIPGFLSKEAHCSAVPDGPVRRADAPVFRALWRLWWHALDSRA